MSTSSCYGPVVQHKCLASVKIIAQRRPTPCLWISKHRSLVLVPLMICLLGWSFTFLNEIDQVEDESA